jgi:hypothetical protein
MLYPPKFGSDPLFPKTEDFEVRFKDENAGKGVFTFHSWQKGEIIARMAGYRIRKIRQHTLQISSHFHNYDPYFSGYFLHSCEPNISLNMRKMTVTALVDIPENSWLYMDYAETEDYLYKTFPCNCGSSSCRGWVTGRMQHEPFLVDHEQLDKKSHVHR